MSNAFARLGAAIAVAFTAASAGAATIDFELDQSSNPLLPGTVVTTQLPFVTLVTTDNRGGGPDSAIIFDSSDAVNAAPANADDEDLLTPAANDATPFENILIISERSGDSNGDQLIDVQDDEAGGGSINFKFSIVGRSATVKILDIEENPTATEGFIEFFRNGGSVGKVAIANVGNNTIQTLMFNAAEFDEMTVDFVGSGAIAEFEVLVPTPTAVMLGAFPLLGLGALRRRAM